MEADTPGRYEEKEEEIEMKERDSGREYLPESHWFSQMSSQKELTWKKGEKKYKYDFFNQFNPKEVFNRRYKDNRNLRLAIVKFFVKGMGVGEREMRPEEFLEDRSPPYFKDIGLKRGRNFTLEFTYKGSAVVGIFDPKIEDPTKRFTKVLGKGADELAKDVIAYYNLKSVKESKSQVKSIMTGDKPKEKLTPPKPRPLTPPKPSVLSKAWGSLKGTTEYASDYFTTKADENLDNTATISARDTTQSFLDIQQQSLRNQLDSYKRINDENQDKLDRMSKQISQQASDISDKEDEIRELQSRLESSREDSEELSQEIAQKNYELRQMETAFDNLKAERDKIVNGAQKHIQDRDSQIQELKNSLELTGSQILQRDEEVKMLQDKLEKTKEYVNRYPQEKANYEDTITELQNDLKTQKSDNKKLKDSYDALKLELEEKKKSSNDKLSKEIESYQSLLESEKGKVENLTQSRKELEKRNKTLVEDFDKLDAQYEATKASLEYVESVKETTIIDLDKLHSKYQEMLKEKDLSDERVLELQQEKESIERELQDERDNYGELVKSRDSFEKKYRSLKQEYEDHKLQTNQYSKTMQKDLDDSRVERGKYEELEQERDSLIQKTQELNRKLETFNQSWDGLKRKHQLEIDRQNQKLKDSNAKLQDIQKKLDAKEISEEKFRQLFNQTENEYKILKKSSDKIIGSKSNNIKELQEKNEAQETRIKELEEIEENYIERVKVKDAEVQEQMDRVKEKEQVIDSLVNKISLQDLYIDQFSDLKRRHQNTTREYNRTLDERNQYITDLSGNETKRHALEKELADLQKELDSQKLEMENLQKKMIDPQELEEAKNHVRELSDELNRKEDQLHDREVEANYYREETENLREYIRAQKQEIENEMLAQREHYEQRIAKREKEFKDQLKNYVRPGDLKAYNMNWDKIEEVEVRKYSDEDLEKVLKKLRTIRDKYRRDAENPSRSSAKRRMDDRFRKSVDYKIDAINHENERAIETSQGKDIILEDKKGILGALYRLRRWTWETGVKYLGVIGSILSIIGTTFYLFCMATGRTLLQGAKDAGKLINAAAGNLPADLLYGLLEGSKLVIHYAKNTLVIITLVVISFVLLYRAYISPNQTEFLVSFLLVGGMVGIGYWYTNYE